MAGAGNLNIKGSVTLSSADRAGLERSIRASRRRVAPYDPRTRTGAERAIEPVTRKVDAPYEPGVKETVQVNRRVDVLEEERAHRRISEAAYLTGRAIQTVFEEASRSAGSNWSGGDRVDVSEAKDNQIVRRLEAAAHIEAEMARLTRLVGTIGARFLREILTGTTYREYAERRGRGGERGTAYVADRFRAWLEDIAEERAAKGPERSRGIRADRGEG